jgi:hypothetical protein
MGMLIVIVHRAHGKSSVGIDLPSVANRASPESPSARPVAGAGFVTDRPMPPPKLNLQSVRGTGSEPPSDSAGDAASGRVSTFDHAIESQAPDLMWADDLRSSLRAAFASMEGVSIDSLECGQTLCRVEIGTTNDESGRPKARDGLARSTIMAGERYFAMTAAPLPPRMVMYMSRENGRLPSLAE